MAKSTNKLDRELGELSMRIDSLEKTTGRIEDKLDKFIDGVDRKYATKDELAELRTHTIQNTSQIEWTKSRVLDLIIKVSNIVIVLGFGSKMLGYW